MGTVQESGLAGTGPAADESISEDERMPIDIILYSTKLVQLSVNRQII